jgi:hypothetical protein
MQIRVYHNVTNPFFEIEPQVFRFSDFRQVDHFLMGVMDSITDFDCLETVYKIHSRLSAASRSLSKGLRYFSVGDMIEISRDGSDWLRYLCTNWGWDKVGTLDAPSL